MSNASVNSRLSEASGALATAVANTMEQTLPWYRELGAQERSWVGQVAQAGIQAFIDWNSHPDRNIALTSDVFGAAPRELTRAVTFEQTVALVRTTIDVVEKSVDSFIPQHEQQQFREAVLRYSREIAFSAAEVYARAAEARGAWDARLEALIIDAFMRNSATEEILSQASALGWSTTGSLLVMAGSPPEVDAEAALSVMRRAAVNHSLDLLTGIQGTVMFAVIGGAGLDSQKTPRLITPFFGPGAVVVSDTVIGLSEIGAAAQSCASAFRAAGSMISSSIISSSTISSSNNSGSKTWSPKSPRPIHVSELLPERAVLGDPTAKEELIDLIYLPLAGDPALLDTAIAYLDNSQSLEATGRTLFVHPNTVRYRIKRIADLTGYDLTNSREAFAIRISIVLGRSALP
jgi:PucR C-terminal helix-turn-helix domain/GGDEF-like domain